MKAKCSNCGAKYEYEEEDAGQEITCECGIRIMLERPLKPCIRCQTKVQDLERGYCRGCREKLAAEKVEIEASAKADAERKRELHARLERDRQEMRLREEERRSHPCANCGVPFGKLEKIYEWNGQNVCVFCIRKLQPAEGPVAPPQQQAARPVLQAGEVICPNPNCGWHGDPIRKNRGSVIVMILLLLIAVLPGLIYAIIMSGTDYFCPRCGMKLRSDHN